MSDEIICQHLYEGKVFDIWAVWQKDQPENYTLGRSQMEARENFALRLEIVFEHGPDGIIARCPKYTELVGHGPSTMKAERHLMRQINLLASKLDWREMFFELVAATGDAWRVVKWDERETEIVRREVERRGVAAQFAVQGQRPISRAEVTRRADAEAQAAQERVFDAEAPFCPD